MGIRIGLAAGLLAIWAGAAGAQQVEELFSHKHWKVSGVAWDDGTIGCVAEVSAPGESFSIWTLQDGSVSLQFYSTAWTFTDGDTADLEVQIDRRSPWNLTGAELSQNSVYFNIPGSDAGGVQRVDHRAPGMWRLHHGQDARQPVQVSYNWSVSIVMVTGPSLTRLTAMSAPNWPFSTGTPWLSSACAK